MFYILDNYQETTPNKAFESIERAKLLFPEKAEFYFHLGNIYGKYGEYEKAEANYHESIQILDKTAQSVSNHIQSLYRSNLGVLYHRWKKLEKAKEMYKKALKIAYYAEKSKDPSKKILANTKLL